MTEKTILELQKELNKLNRQSRNSFKYELHRINDLKVQRILEKVQSNGQVSN